MSIELKAGSLSPRYWPTWLWIGLLRSVVLLPHSWRLRIGRMLGRLLYRLAGSRRRVVATNLKLCFPEKSDQQRRQMVREVFEHNGIGVLEVAMAWWLPDNRLLHRYRLIGEQHLKQAQQEGKGVILLSAHFPTLDLGPRLLMEHYPVDCVYRPHNNPALEAVIKKGRRRYAGQAIERHNMRAMVRRLKHGNIIWYAPDQDHGPTHSVYAPFFGVEAATVTATARLARLSGAKVMMFCQHRCEDGSYELEIFPPLEDFPSGDDRLDCSRVNAEIERGIRKFPSQYMWVHRRFKTHPKGKNYLYRRDAETADS
ncbi:LpxL/LpxP family Kdo(2)-lipid IV(A) lauroyl/palmitoleoyl acyltransferase [Marinobacterium sp. CAU 1594]|nr:LpxL/LpxP family Kdo(2)-lipid IV(A) lauroyl/palmitoleoyl acyltransferase [Marinobacterium arenosum]